MDMEIYKAMCYSLAKAYTTGVRIYQDETPLYYYSSYYIEPDPFGPFLHQITDSDQEAGIITTSLYQFYAFLTLKPGLRLIIGPTRALNEDGKAMDELLATLGVGKDEKNHYVRWLCSAPVIHIERLAWLIVSLMTSIQKRPFPVEKVWKEKPSVSMEESVRMAYTERTMNNLEDMGISQALKQCISWDQMVAACIEEGQTERLREMFSAPPKVHTGNLISDGLHQIKNRGISMASQGATAATQGGVDPYHAFLMADLYTQKLELMQDFSAVEHLIQEMMIDFAEQVEKLKVPNGNRSPFCRMCIQYVSQNVFAAIRLENMARELGYSRSYLCSHFKKEMGISLSHYIQQKKIEEAKKLLQFSDRSLSEIASLLNFSSQSHFQTIFRKSTGVTPLSYRKQTK